MATDPSYPWLPADKVLRAVGIGEADRQAPAVEDARLAAGALVERARRDLLVAAPTLEEPLLEVFTPSADVVQGAVMLANRLHARRGSPAGLASFAEFGPSAVLRFDPDIDRLLGLGRYARPKAR